MSKSKATPTERGVKATGRPDAVGSPPQSHRTAQPGSPTSRGGPEWTTERWKLQVEAEARGRLKKNIRGVGADR